MLASRSHRFVTASSKNSPNKIRQVRGKDRRSPYMSEGGPLPRQQGPALNPSVLGQGAHCSPVGGASEKNGGRTRVWRVFPSDFSSAVSFLKILARHLVSDHCNYHCDPGAALSSTVQLPRCPRGI